MQIPLHVAAVLSNSNAMVGINTTSTHAHCLCFATINRVRSEYVFSAISQSIVLVWSRLSVRVEVIKHIVL